MKRGERLPTIRWILADSEGFLWMGRYTLVGRPPRIYDVFSPDGVRLGSVEFPDNFWPYEIGFGHVLGRWTDDLDVNYVHRYDLDRASYSRGH
jgi:hypothetical protein